MPNKLRYTVLPVGQGSGTLIQVLDSGGVPIETSLIDLGSLGWSKQAGKPSADFVIAELKKMAVPQLKALFLSHSDGDHTNLLGRVLDAFYKPSDDEPADETLIIKEVWYGGEHGHYKKRSKNIIDRVKTYRPTGTTTNINDLGLRRSSWRGDDPKPLYKTGNGVNFWLLYGNAPVAGKLYGKAEPSRKGSRAYLRNVSSLVLVVRYGSATSRKLVALGDATGLTLAGCNAKIDEQKIKLGPVATLSLPHHGSQVTTYDMLGLKTDTLDQGKVADAIVKAFVDHLKPFSITASAGEDHHHKHPASRVIKDFGTHLGEKLYTDAGVAFREQHFFTSHYAADDLGLMGSSTTVTWPPKTGWYTGRTAKNAFTIDYFRGDPKTLDIPTVFPPDAVIDAPKAPYKPVPPRAAGWAWEVEADGSDYDLLRVVDRNFTAVATMTQLEAVHGGLSPERFVLVPSAPVPEQAPPPPPRPPVVVAVPVPVPSPFAPPPAPPAGSRRIRQIP